ncbi:MAG: hypothetical protein A3A24_02010 [Candidatus Buchananbacteria bacterium RIFCSPLOWO2_01_FULL_46_12]|uniref:Uncharacterized protein n=2 Tax=Candidatus Buchananiibacteriota TaxID=1817903 RepID=A0A1G1YS96_9BACT|nr:MAG: hypothetical protein A2744_00130 [Candidatus Buchananbacteria bacterium RIFCSPHIGHO2_01_FULL_44_11]OGY55228.1 MAG: hypothetical protein A3A24_02010 [Candidatus Buchananbacteria bacterium RIFCSPLOWO2_01_FULL_46_12]
MLLIAASSSTVKSKSASLFIPVLLSVFLKLPAFSFKRRFIAVILAFFQFSRNESLFFGLDDQKALSFRELFWKINKLNYREKLSKELRLLIFDCLTETRTLKI